MTPGLGFTLWWKFQNAGLFCLLVAIFNQSENKFQERMKLMELHYMKHMKFMELPQNPGKCQVGIVPSPRLISAPMTLECTYHSACARMGASGQIA